MAIQTEAKIPVQTTLTPQTAADLNKLAHLEGTSVARLIRLAVEQMLAAKAAA